MGSGSSHARTAEKIDIKSSNENNSPTPVSLDTSPHEKEFHKDDKSKHDDFHNLNQSNNAEDVSKDGKISEGKKSDGKKSEESQNDHSQVVSTLKSVEQEEVKDEPAKAETLIACDKVEQKKSHLEEAQEKFDWALRCCCELIKPDEILKSASKDVRKLDLHRSPPPGISLCKLMEKLPLLQELDVSGNQLGPAGFRAVMYALSQNSTITILNLADNQADTDSSESIGEMLRVNQTLTSLDVSGNHLGKDYFSRCVGPALSDNTSLTNLRCESIGSTDMSVLMENLLNNGTLKQLHLAHNEISDSKAFVTGISTWLKSPGCVLHSMDLKNCGLKAGDFDTLTSALQNKPKNLTNLTVSGNQVASHQSLLDFLVACFCHTSIAILKADDIKIAKSSDWKPGTEVPSGTISPLEVLSLTNCSLKDSHITALSQHVPASCLHGLKELTLSNNTDLTVLALQAFHTLTAAADQPSSLEKLSYGQNPADWLPNLLATGLFPALHYLNLRRSKISAGQVAALCAVIKDEGLKTLVLDGIKLSGSKALGQMFGIENSAFVTSGAPSLAALSLAGCQLNDSDLKPLCDAIQHGMPLRMLKVANNRLTDIFISALIEALKAQPEHQLALIDISSNKVSKESAVNLTEFLKNLNHKSNLRSINLSSNVIDPEGIAALVSALGGLCLTSLQASNQQTRYEEEDMIVVYDTLTRTLGMTVEREGENIKPHTSSLPNLPLNFSCKLQGLGGHTGELGEKLDSAAICTDFQKKKLPYLTFHHILEISASLKGYTTSDCPMTSAEWNNIISAQKDAPTWLQVSEYRPCVIYLSHLPASISVQKLEGLLEMEADCGVKEVYLCKDLVTRKNNGFAWVLLSDQESVEKAVTFFQQGQAVVLGMSFVISAINISVNDDANSEAVTKARRDMEQRASVRHKEDKEHRALIRENYQISQDRHAYRLAHPAYADGRIW